MQDPKISTCLTDDIAAYVDGELEPAHESLLEAHLADCGACSLYLNEQKRFLRDLDLSLKHEGDLELPVNFAKTVAVSAESSVAGLRRPIELFNTIFICVGVIVFLLFFSGWNAGGLGKSFSTAIDQLVVVGSFFGHVAY